MKLIDRYLNRVLVQNILLVLFAISGLQLFMDFFNELRQLGTGDYTLWRVVEYVVLNLPWQIYQLFPIITLIGAMLGLGLLAVQQELLVLRASGVSRTRVWWGALKSVLFLTVLMFVVGECLGPFASNHGAQLKSWATSSGQAIKTKQGIWLKDKNNFYHIRKMIDGYEMLGIDRYVLDDHWQLTEVSHAPKGYYQKGIWRMQGVRTTVFGSAQLSTRSSAEEKWAVSLDLLGFGSQSANPNQLSLLQLTRTIHFLHQSELSSTRYAINLWQRLFLPLTVVVMLSLAIPFVFLNPRFASFGNRFAIAVLVSFVYYICQQMLVPLADIYQLPVLGIALVPSMLFALLAVGIWRLSARF